jgi:hypothetical protein
MIRPDATTTNKMADHHDRTLRGHEPGHSRAAIFPLRATPTHGWCTRTISRPFVELSARLTFDTGRAMEQVELSVSVTPEFGECFP